MLAFEVSLNGELLYVAGLAEGMSIITNIHAMKLKGIGEGRLMTAIPSSPDGPATQIQWGGNQRLSIGDLVTVKLVEIDHNEMSEPDEPAEKPLARGRFFTRP